MGYNLGIDLGGTKILAGVLDNQGNVLSKAKRKTRADGSIEKVIDRIVDVTNEALVHSDVSIAKIECIGVGAPGPLDPLGEIVHEAPNLGWRDVDLARILREKFGRPIYLSNDVDAGTWGEFIKGAGRGSANCLGAFVGTGLGGGLVFDGNLYRGSGTMAGEIGHTLIDRDGPVCVCGRKGCLEAYTSYKYISRSIWRQVEQGKMSIITSLVDEPGGEICPPILKAAIEKGDEMVVDAVETSARILGLGLGSACNLINPDRIVLGGGVVEEFGAVYMNKVEEGFNVQAFKAARKMAKIVTASLRGDAGIIGAILLARSAMNGR